MFDTYDNKRCLKLYSSNNTSNCGAALFLLRSTASYLLLDTDAIVLFVSDTAPFCHARLLDDVNRVMELAKRFQESTAYASVNVNYLEPHKLYPIIKAKRISTKYGTIVVLTLRISETSIVQLFLPKRYSEVISDADIDSINSKVVALHLPYEGVCENSKFYLLAIAS